MKAKAKQNHDYLAVIMIGCAGSWARGSDKNKTLARVLRIFKSDFSKLYKIPKGHKIIANVIDVTGYDRVLWDERGFFSDDKMVQLIDRPIEKCELTF